MTDWMPFFTQDGSVGLYSKSDNDIYHSVYGALTEAYYKFILPANFNEYFKHNNEIKILDLCYGIGYNTKSFLNYFFQNCCPLTENIDTIDTDNNSIQKNNESIHANNIFNKKCINEIFYKKFFGVTSNNKFNIKNYKIQIDAVDINKLLMTLSPLFKSYSKHFFYDKTGIASVDKYLKNNYSNSKKPFCKIHPEVNIILLNNLLKNFNEGYLSDELDYIITNKKYHKFLDTNLCHFMRFYFSKVYNLSSYDVKLPFLHNIYYEYISSSYKNTLKVLKNNEISIRYITQDARKFLSSINQCYDFIFLDGFSPDKCPSLWTFEFFSLLFNHLSANGKILTYSNSSAVRNAMLKNNFYVSKIFNENENKYTGTIAVKNPNLINNNMTDYDFGLLNTKAGIMYRDYGLSADSTDILNNRKIALQNSDLQSTTQYKKNNKGVLNEI